MNNYFVYPNIIPELTEGKSTKVMHYELHRCRLVYGSPSKYTTFLNDISKIHNSVREPDYYVVSVALSATGKCSNSTIDEASAYLCENLKYFSSYPEKHIFFLTGDHVHTGSVLKNSLVFKNSCPVDSNAIALHYSCPLDISGEIPTIKDCKKDVLYQGAVPLYALREKIKDIKFKNLRFTYRPQNKFHGVRNKYAQILAEWSWKKNICNHKFIICPRGIGLNTVKFFESMKFGRIPVLISDGLKLPLEHLIDYDSFVVRVPERDILNTEDYILNFISKKNLDEASQKSRKSWENYFPNEKFDFVLEKSLECV